MSYQVWILRSAQRQLAALPRNDYMRLRDAIRALGDDPRPRGSRKLVGREGWRIRVGDLRAIFDIDDREKRITVVHVGRRRDVYR